MSLLCALRLSLSILWFFSSRRWNTRFKCDWSSDVCSSDLVSGPVAVVNRRAMAPGIEGLEGTTKAHDAIPVELAIKYLEKRGYTEAAAMLKNAKKQKSTTVSL